MMMDPPDRLAQQLGDGERDDLIQFLFGGQRNAVGNDDGIDGCGIQSLDGLAGENTVRCRHVDFACAGGFHQLGGPAYRPRGADHVIKHEGNFSIDRPADEVGLFHCGRIFSAFIDDGDRPTQASGMPDRPFDAAFIGTNDH